jgi:hypothetical protein
MCPYYIGWCFYTGGDHSPSSFADRVSQKVFDRDLLFDPLRAKFRSKHGHISVCGLHKVTLFGIYFSHFQNRKNVQKENRPSEKID